MLVIHPTDRTTEVLSGLYEGREDLKLYRDYLSGQKMGSLLHSTPKGERIMLLGHGSPNGLFWRLDDSRPEFDAIIVAHRHGYALRQHGGNIVAVFCHAAEFARRERLHGLFTGMIISEMSEAEMYGVSTTQQELDVELPKFVARLRRLLDEEVPMNEIPAMMLAMDDAHTPLTEFNYQRIHYL